MVALGRDNRLILTSLFLWGSGEGLWIYIQPLYTKRLGASPVQIGLTPYLFSKERQALLTPASFRDSDLLK